MRDNETGAAVSGVYPAQYKVLAFATSALVTSVGGGCFALAATTIGPDTFGLQRSIEFIAGLVIGGVATIIGPAIGGVLVDWLPHLSLEGEFVFSDSTTFSLPFLPTLEGPEATILYGILLVLIIFFMPGGIVYGLRVLRSKFMLIVPLLPTPTTATHTRGRGQRPCCGAGSGRGGDVDADFTFGPGVCPNIHTGPPTRGGRQ